MANVILLGGENDQTTIDNQELAQTIHMNTDNGSELYELTGEELDGRRVYRVKTL